MSFPRNTWYAAAASTEVGRAPLGRRVLGTTVVLYRDSRGDAVALEDRCVHRPYPLSKGRVEGDEIICGYSGFRYGSDGHVVSVPTQQNVPVGAKVTAYPVRESGGLVWVWLGEPSRAGRVRAPELSWLSSPDWHTFGQQWETRASAQLLQDNFADITHVAEVDPTIAPPALQSAPPLEVEVTETQVRFWRDFEPTVVPSWQAEMMGVAVDAELPQREEGRFVSPGLWVDRWDVEVPEGQGTRSGTHTLLFTHAITPIDERTTRHAWRVSRNFAESAAAQGTLEPIMTAYYRRMQEILETMQDVLDDSGPRREVAVQADAAMVQVRRIMRRLANED